MYIAICEKPPNEKFNYILGQQLEINNSSMMCMCIDVFNFGTFQGGMASEMEQ